jgi:hypothetical protein
LGGTVKNGLESILESMPLMMACLVGGLVGFIIVKFVVKEQQDDAAEQTKSIH